MKVVHFGAGNIGRGFIGELLHDSGYEIVFLDVSEDMVREINATHSYELRLIDHNYEAKIIDQVSAVSMQDEDKAVKEILEADLITTSVWANNLNKIAPLLVKGIKARNMAKKKKINIMACENAIMATMILKKAMMECGISESELDQAACYPSTAVDRIVVGEKKDGKSIVNIADYNELVIEQNHLVNPDDLPIKGAKYTDNLEKYLKRKLYIVNCGHAWAGYMGYIHGYTSAREVFLTPEFVVGIRGAMQEAASYIEKKYAFSKQEMQEYVDFAIKRYQAKGVDYQILMVTRSPIRKLGANDRMVGPCLGCQEYGLPNEHLLKGIAMILLFDNENDAEAAALQEYIQKFGVEEAIQHFTGIEKGSEMHTKIVQYYQEQKNIKNN